MDQVTVPAGILRQAIEDLAPIAHNATDDPREAAYNVMVALRKGLEQPVQEPDYKRAHEVWQDKTEWVQETAQPHELGMHRADVLRQRIEQLKAQQPAVKHPKSKAIEECLHVLRPVVKGRFPQEQALDELVGYLTAPQKQQPKASQ